MPHGELASLHHSEALAYSILRRLTAINIHCAGTVDKADTIEPPCKVTDASIAELATLSPHVLCKVASGMKYKKCKQYSPKPDLKEWLGTPCPGIITVGGIISIGNREIHPTHKARVSKGVLWCGRCGSYSVNRVDKLGRACKSPTVVGKANRNRLAAGHRPQNLRAWPDYGDGANERDRGACARCHLYLSRCMCHGGPLTTCNSLALSSSVG